MKRAPRSLQHHVLYRKYNGQDSEISALLGKCGSRKNLADTTFVIWALTSVLASVDGFFIFLYSLLGAEHPYYCLGKIDSVNIEYCNGIDNVQNLLVWFSVVSLFWLVFSVRRGIGYDPLFMWVFDKRR
jgi:hypothetical protein